MRSAQGSFERMFMCYSAWVASEWLSTRATHTIAMKIIDSSVSFEFYHNNERQQKNKRTNRNGGFDFSNHRADDTIHFFFQHIEFVNSDAGLTSHVSAVWAMDWVQGTHNPCQFPFAVYPMIL